MFEIILSAIALITLIIATISDLRTKEIPDYLNYSVIAVVLFIRLVHSSLTLNYSFIINAVIILAVVYGLGLLLFYTRAWGGGDTKILMALSVIFATPIKLFEFTRIESILNIPYIAVFFLNIMIGGAIYSLIYITVLIIKHRKKFIENFKELSRTKLVILSKIILLVFSLFALIVFFMINQMLIIMLVAWMIFFYYAILSIKAIDKACMFRWIDVNKLVEGDYIIKEVKYKGKVLASPKDLCVTKKQIQLLKRYNIKKVLIKDGIAFAPVFLIGSLITLVFGNIVLWLI